MLISVTILVVLAVGATNAFGQDVVAKLQMVSGDRQITVNVRSPSLPYVVRAVDAAGKPVAGVGLLIQPAIGGYGPTKKDEFGFRGFNTPLDYLPRPTGPVPTSLAMTGPDGLAEATPDHVDGWSSAFLVSASNYSNRPPFPPVYFSAVRLSVPPSGNPSMVVEFVDADLGHYFNTLLQSEIDALEADRFPGWKRSIGAFIAYATAQDAPPDTVPVCRFFSSTYTSHFYTADPGECDAVVAKWPDVWKLETRTAFYIQVPDKATGACGPGLQSIYRMYSTRNGPNHRYVADSKLRDAMGRAGWAAEGYGPESVMLCTAK